MKVHSDTYGTAADRKKHAKSILDGYSSNDWGGSATLRDLSECRYAIVVERSDDSWVLGANDVSEIASIALATLIDTNGYDEWIAHVFNLDTGEEISWKQRVTVEIEADGKLGRKSA